MIVPLMANADNDFFITEPIPEPEPEPPTVYLLRDEFTTAEAAPVASPRTAEPGPGSLTFVDTNNIMSISGGRKVTNGTPQVNDLVVGSLVARQAGNAFLWRVPVRTSLSGANARYGLGSGNSNQSLDIGLDYASTTAVRIKNINAPIDTVTIGSGDHAFAAIMRATGGFLLSRNGTSGNFTLQWVYATETAGLYPKSAYTSSTLNIADDSWRVLNLGAYDARFATDYGIATDREAGSVSAGTTFSHTANCIIEFVVTTRPSADNVDVFFRVQDASNYWRCRITSAGNITLDEVVAGVASNRGSAVGVVSSGHRVVIIADGTTIRGYSNNVLRWTYASATNFQAATSGELDALGTSGVVSDLISWPRTVTLPDV